MATPSTAHPRQPRGQPTGGQFAAKSNPEANLELEPSWPGLVRRSQSYEDNSSVEWWSDANGQLQDPPDGTPAMCWRYSNSSVRSEEHYQAGQLQDPPDGSPAVRGLHLDGSVMYEQHWVNHPALKDGACSGAIRCQPNPKRAG